MSVEHLGLAIVGCGQIVTHHVAALATVGGLEVKALCDPSPERRRIIRELCEAKAVLSSSAHGGSATQVAEFSTLDELLLETSVVDSCQVIFIAVPHDLHVSVACRALESGRHVVLEKPLAPTLEGCRRLQDAARLADGLLIVAEQSPYWQEIVKAKELLRSGSIGSLVTASSYFYESMRDNVTSGVDEGGGLGWRRSLERCGGGIVIDGGLHWIRPLRFLCGDVESVVGVTQNAETSIGLEGETLAHALLKIRVRGDDDGGADGGDEQAQTRPLLATFSANNMHTAPMAHDSCPYFRLTGSKGELVVPGTGLFPNGGGGLRLYNEDNPGGRDLFPGDRQGGFFLGFAGLWEAVSDILTKEDRKAAEKSVRDAAADVAVALAIYKSTRSGQWEKCETFDR